MLEIQKIANSRIAVIAIVVFSLVMAFAQNFIKSHKISSVLGVVFVCFVSNATVLLPSASMITIVQAALLLNPLIVGIAGGFGCAIGEMVSFLLGNVISLQTHNGKIISFIENIKTYFEIKPYCVVFIFSIIPLPIFDFVGLLAGACKLNPFKYFTACSLGKIIKCTFFALIASRISVLFS